jgi:hypothetical protein
LRSIRHNTTCAGGDLELERQRPSLRDLLKQVDRLAVLAPSAGHQAGGVLEKLRPVHRRPPERHGGLDAEIGLGSLR